MIIQINYDLKKPGQNYTGLIEKIKNLGTSWAHPCESCWLVRTSKNASEVSDALKPLIDDNDSLLISRFDISNYSGWLSKKIWDWIKSEDLAHIDLR